MLKDEEAEVLRYGACLRVTVQHSQRDHGLSTVLLFQKGPQYLSMAVIHNQQELNSSLGT